MTAPQVQNDIVQGCPSTMGDDYQLNTTTLIRHAARTHPEQEIVYRTANGGWDRYTYGDCYERICRTANALRALGVRPGDRVGILDWNSRRHFELYYAIPGLAAMMLQMNLRLGVEDLSYVVGHSQTKFIVVDETLLPMAEAIAAHVPGVKGWIVMTDKPLVEIKTTLAPLYHHEDLLAAADTGIAWPMVDEHSAYSACYTTGATGLPKGVYYSHRGIYLHSMALATNVATSHPSSSRREGLQGARPHAHHRRLSVRCLWQSVAYSLGVQVAQRRFERRPQFTARRCARWTD